MMDPVTSAIAIPGPGVRAFDPEHDYGPVAAFLRETNQADGTDWLPSEAVLRDEWGPTLRHDPSTDALVAEADGRIVAIADTAWRIRGPLVSHEIYPVVRPDMRRRGLGRELLRWAESRAREIATASGDARPHVLDGFFETHVAGVAEFATAAGYAPHAYGFLMRRRLDEPIPDAPLPPGLEIRPVRPQDHRAIWDADIEAFLDHPEPAERDESDFASWFAQPGIDTDLWRVAWAGDEVAGSAMTLVATEENELLGVRRAWIEHVSVRRPWRRRGLASALIVEAIRALREGGLEEVVLGVHGENPTGALGLYEQLGFSVYRRWQLWRKPIEGLDR